MNIEKYQPWIQSCFLIMVGIWIWNLLLNSTSYYEFFRIGVFTLLQTCYFLDPSPIVILEENPIQISKIP